MSAHTLFVAAPAAAVVWLAALLALRLLLPPAPPAAAAAERGATVRTFRGHWLWHAGILGTVAAHALVLLAPQAMMAWNARLPRLVAFEVASFAFGLAAALGLAAVLRGHVRDQALRSVRTLADTVLLGLLAVSIASGLGIAVLHRWASSWSLVTLSPYVRSPLALHPDVALVEGMPYLVKLHVLAAVAFVFVLPASRLLDLALLPLDRALAAAARPLVAAARRLGHAAEGKVRRAARAFWWEEDEDRLA